MCAITKGAISTFIWVFVVALAPQTLRTCEASPYADAINDSLILPGDAGNSHPNPAEALGAPNSDEAHKNYVSLGGPGAWVILDMGEDSPVIDGPGADIEVREMGDAFGGVSESYVLSVSDSPLTNSFVQVGTGTAVTLFDISPSGVATARYVRIVDLAAETLDSQSPGSDIDSVTSLHSADAPLGPANLTASFTGQGIMLSWAPDPSDETYHIRRSLTESTFPSSPHTTLLPPEHGFHDTEPLDVGDLWYSVVSVTGETESVQAIAGLPGYTLVIDTQSVYHVGDGTIPEWEVPEPATSVAFTVFLPTCPEGPLGKLTMEVFDVDNSGNAVLANGASLGPVPEHGPSTWATQSQSFAVGPLKAGTNTLTIVARDSGGDNTGNLDDFMIRNIRLSLYGDTNSVPLPWEVGYSPTLTPPTWQTISEPIRWSGAATNSSGFFRLQLP